jgi:hypothetical protein
MKNMILIVYRRIYGGSLFVNFISSDLIKYTRTLYLQIRFCQASFPIHINILHIGYLVCHLAHLRLRLWAGKGTLPNRR